MLRRDLRLVVLFTMFALRFLSSRRVHVFRVALQFFAWRSMVALQFFAWRLGCWRGVAPATTMDSAHKIEYVDYFILAVLPVVKHCIFKAFWRCRPV